MEPMQIGGFRIQVTCVATGRFRAISARLLLRASRADSAEAAYLSWLLLDPEPCPGLSAATAAAVADGSYWVPALEISRLLVQDHIALTG
jgi:hypothetical protein